MKKIDYFDCEKKVLKSISKRQKQVKNIFKSVCKSREQTVLYDIFFDVPTCM